MNYNPYELLE